MGACSLSICRAWPRRCWQLRKTSTVTLRHAALASAVLLLLSSTGFSQTVPVPGSRPPDFTVQIWGDAVADFSARVRAYVDLRTRLEIGLPPLIITPNPAEILRAEEALAHRLRHVRKDVREGNIFAPTISAAFRAALLPELDAETVIAIMDENPGEFSHQVDGTYPKKRTVSTVPANVLAVLPELPTDIQYRFLGRHLVLHDTRANVIVDRMTCAIECRR